MQSIKILLVGIVCCLAVQCHDSSDNNSDSASPVTVIGGSGSTSQPRSMNDLATIYFQSASTLSMEVWYEANAAPYSKEALNTRPYWSVLRANLNALMQYRTTPPTLEVPESVDDMHLLEITKQENWTAEQIRSLAATHNTGSAPAGTSRFYVYFLDGYYSDGQGSETSVLGVHLGNSNILAMFKPVIASTSNGAANIVPRFVEQSTLIHEMGHAIGLVNNGVPMSSPHQDSEHGAHSTNSDSVMYWLNEGASDMVQFIQKYIATEDPVMWGPEDLADAQAISK